MNLLLSPMRFGGITMLHAKNLKKKTNDAIERLENERLKILNEKRLLEVELAKRKAKNNRLKRRLERKKLLEIERKKEREEKQKSIRMAQEKIKAEKIRNDLVEKRRLERATQLEQKRIEAFVRRVYHGLLREALSGNSEVVLKTDSDLSETVLQSYGIVTSKAASGEAFLNESQRMTLKLLRSSFFSKKLAGYFPISKVASTYDKARRLGFLAASESVSQLFDISYRAIKNEIDDLTRQKLKYKDDRYHFQLKTCQHKWNALEAWRSSHQVNEKNLRRIANGNADGMRVVSAEYDSWIMFRRDSSLPKQAAFLRYQIQKNLSDVSAERLSDIDVINLYRFWVGKDAISSDVVERHPGTTGDIFEARNYERRIAQIKEEIAKINLQHKQAIICRNEIERKIRQVEQLAVEQHKLKSNFSQLVHSSNLTLYNHSSGRFFYSESGYKSYSSFRLLNGGGNIHPNVHDAHLELAWLQSGDGQRFLEYLEAVLETLAESGYDSANVVVNRLNSSLKLFLGGVSLMAEIRVDLLALIFDSSGFKLNFARSFRGDVFYVLEW